MKRKTLSRHRENLCKGPEVRAVVERAEEAGLGSIIPKGHGEPTEGLERGIDTITFAF